MGHRKEVRVMQEENHPQIKTFLENYILKPHSERSSGTYFGRNYDSKRQALSKSRNSLLYWLILVLACSIIFAYAVYPLIIENRAQIERNKITSSTDLSSTNENKITTTDSDVIQVQAMELSLGQRLQERVTLEFKNTPIEDVLTSIANTVNAEIVINSEIKGIVSYQFTNTPVEEILNGVLSASGFSYIVDNNKITIEPIKKITDLEAIKAGEGQAELAGSEIPLLQNLQEEIVIPKPPPKMVTGIIFGENPTASIDGRIIHEGDTIDGVKVVKIDMTYVEFDKDGKKWAQKVHETPASYWD